MTVQPDGDTEHRKWYPFMQRLCPSQLATRSKPKEQRAAFRSIPVGQRGLGVRLVLCNDRLTKKPRLFSWASYELPGRNGSTGDEAPSNSEDSLSGAHCAACYLTPQNSTMQARRLVVAWNHKRRGEVGSLRRSSEKTTCEMPILPGRDIAELIYVISGLDRA